MENFNIFAIINLKMKNQEALTEKKTVLQGNLQIVQ